MELLFMGPLLASIVGLFIPTAPRSAATSYDGHGVFRVRTGSHLQVVQQKLSYLTYEQWNHDTKHHIDIVVPPSQIPVFSTLGFDALTMHTDLGKSIREESSSRQGWGRKWKRGEKDWLDEYHDYEDHLKYLDDLHNRFKENSEIISSGMSYEGRDIKGIHLWGSGGKGKPAVLYHATVHAREWIAAPVRTHTPTLIHGF